MIKKLFLAFILICCFVINAGAFGPMMSMIGGADYSDITFWWRCETADFSGTNGTLDYSAGDDVADLTSEAAINTDAVKYGTNGLDCPTNYDVARFVPSNNDIIDSSEGRIGFWLRTTTWVDGL